MLAGYTKVPSDYTGKVYLEGQIAALEHEIQQLKSLQADSFRGQSMNDKIKALMGKVLDEHFKETWTSMSYQDLEKFSGKFAELIIQECISTVALNELVNEDDIKGSNYDIAYLNGNNDGVVDVIGAIKQHFGVE
jgi:hypothetical protein